MIRLYFVDNHPLILEGLQVLLGIENDIALVGKARSGYDCLKFLLHNRTDIVVMDACLPDIDGIELCATIKIEYPDTKVLILSALQDRKYIADILQCGASGYVLNNVDKDELLYAIHAVHAGDIYLSPDIKDAGRSRDADIRHHFPPLTRREKEVLFLISEGYTNTQIAEKLFISADTVNTHRKKLLAKLEVKNTAMLIKYAVDNKLLV
ncbi:response regulator [Chitinophaga tropicalis]|uniref:Response regulator n=1 Tax=Chitinophaga tropicalis TaxID=2683588 RepID=A0A7K1UDV1_9BACT|nr:response regulator transcription factor [Chitinophaga tropicalis]MVT12552.1 response regulator [Chitinophaga tropicalis]